MNNNVPEHLRTGQKVEKHDAGPSQFIPRLILCQKQTKAVEDGNAKAGDWIIPEPLEVLKDVFFAVIGVLTTWRLYASDESDAELVWEKPDNEETRELPECQWGEKKKPEAALTYTFLIYIRGRGYAVMRLTRSAVKAAQALIQSCNSWGDDVPSYAGYFKLGSIDGKGGGRSFKIPSFAFSNQWATTEEAAIMKDSDDVKARILRIQSDEPETTPAKVVPF